MHYVVTGGAGFIGSHLVEYLLEQGHAVTVLDNFSPGRRENIAPWLGAIRLIEGSVVDAASSSAYGDTAELPKREDMPPRPRSPYAVGKSTGEQYCRAFHASYGLPTVALRYFNIFGPRQDPTSEYSAVIPKFITAAVSGQPPVIHGDGEQTRDFTYVANAVRANLLACEAPAGALGEVFNVGGGRRISINGLWHRIRALLGSTVTAAYAPPRPGDVRDSLASLERTTDYLGYLPTISLEEGLAATVAHYARPVVEACA